MSNFICEYCQKEIIDSNTGYVTFCKHYPKEYDKKITLEEYLLILIKDEESVVSKSEITHFEEVIK